MTRRFEEHPPTPEQQRDPKYWLGQLWGVWQKILVFTFVGLGLVLLVRFGPGALFILVPVSVLLFGGAMYAWARFRFRKKR